MAAGARARREMTALVSILEGSRDNELKMLWVVGVGCLAFCKSALPWEGSSRLFISSSVLSLLKDYPLTMDLVESISSSLW